MNGKAKPAWSLTSDDVERLLAVFARTLARALVEELRREGLGDAGLERARSHHAVAAKPRGMDHPAGMP